MIDDASSKAILTHLRKGRCWIEIDTADKNSLSSSGQLEMKCG